MLRQEELAGSLGVTRQTLSGYERGLRPLPEDKAIVLLDIWQRGIAAVMSGRPDARYTHVGNYHTYRAVKLHPSRSEVLSGGPDRLSLPVFASA